MFTPRTDHLDHLGNLEHHLDLSLRYDARDMGIVQIQPRKHALDYADLTVPTGNMTWAMKIIQTSDLSSPRDIHTAVDQE